MNFNKKLTRQLTRFAYDHNGQQPANDTDQLPGCCGVVCIDGLQRNTVTEQLSRILSEAGYADVDEYYFDDDGGGGVTEEMVDTLDTSELYSQMIISDVISSGKWKETKSAAVPGPISKNRKTGNKFRIWVITEETIEELIEMLPKTTREKYFSDKPAETKTKLIKPKNKAKAVKSLLEPSW